MAGAGGGGGGLGGSGEALSFFHHATEALARWQ